MIRRNSSIQRRFSPAAIPLLLGGIAVLVGQRRQHC
jgi:hypothetical protein